MMSIVIQNSDRKSRNIQPARNFITYFDQSQGDLLKNTRKRFAKKLLGLGCRDKTASENDFSMPLFYDFQTSLKLINLKQTGFQN